MNPSPVPAEGNATHNTQAIALPLRQSLLCSGHQDPKVLFPTFFSVLHKRGRKTGWVGVFFPMYLNPQSSAHHHWQCNMIVKKKNYRLMGNECKFPSEDKSEKGFQKLLLKRKKKVR